MKTSHSPYRSIGTPCRHQLRHLFHMCITVLWVLGIYTDRQLLQYAADRAVKQTGKSRLKWCRFTWTWLGSATLLTRLNINLQSSPTFRAICRIFSLDPFGLLRDRGEGEFPLSIPPSQILLIGFLNFIWSNYRKCYLFSGWMMWCLAQWMLSSAWAMLNIRWVDLYYFLFFIEF